MTDDKIKRINFLAKKAKSEGLTDAEKEEQAKLRAEYIQGFRNSMKTQLDNIRIVDEKGNRTPIKRKK